MTEERAGLVETPSYIFDTDALIERIGMIRAHLGEGIRLVYAMKANPFLIDALVPHVDAFEVCSPGEAHICEKAGIPGEMLVLSGVQKEERDFLHFADIWGEKPIYTVESPMQMEMLERVAASKHLRLKVLLRITSGNQFGMDEETVENLIKELGSHFPHLAAEGLQLFSGTQKKERAIEKELKGLDAFMGHLAAEQGFRTRILEYGPGLPVSYFENEAIRDDELLSFLTDQLSGLHFHGQITLEMGRFIAAYCGSYVTRVMDLKANRGVSYAIVDGGIHQVNYYGQMMAMKVPVIRAIPGAETNREASHRPGTQTGSAPGSGSGTQTGSAPGSGDGTQTAERPEHLYCICGSLCTTADVLVREVSLPELAVGDVLVFERTGAYSVTEGISLFLSRDLPKVYIKKNGALTLVRDTVLTEDYNHG